MPTTLINNFCTKCGLCCCFCDIIPELMEYNRGDGLCKYLQKDKTCAIYDSRPEVCNVQLMYDKKYKHDFEYSKYIELTKKYCEIFQSYELMIERIKLL